MIQPNKKVKRRNIYTRLNFRVTAQKKGKSEIFQF